MRLSVRHDRSRPLRFAVKRAGMVLATATLALAIVPTPASALVQSALRGCNATAEEVGNCLGWTAFEGENKLVASIRSALLQGKVKAASNFFRQVSSNIPDSQRTATGEAISMAESGNPADAARKYLSPQVANDSDLHTADIVQPMVSQIDNGEPTATGYYTWTLHNSHSVAIYYGSCTNWSSCSTGGYFYADINANTIWPSEGAWIDETITHGGGLSATITNHKLREYQDKTLATDPVISTFNCPTSGTVSLACSGNGSRSDSQGNWYYFRIDWTTNPTGYPSSSFTMETRRWYVNSSSDWQFKAYANGG